MHVVIAWWDGTRGAASGTARTVRTGETGCGPAVSAPLAGEYPGLRNGQWIDDPVAGREGLALIWDCADSADQSPCHAASATACFSCVRCAGGGGPERPSSSTSRGGRP